MKAALFRRHGGPDVIEIGEVPRPAPGPGEALVAVRAVALNHLDLWVRRGLEALSGLPLPHVGGAEVAGTVEQLGDGVSAPPGPGDRVVIDPCLSCGRCEWCRQGEQSLCTSLRVLGEHVHGGLAEYVRVPAANLLTLPEHVSFEDAAATPLVFGTAWRGLVGRGRLTPGASVLVLGASGGVASAAVQIAHQLGARVFAVTSGPDNVRRVEALGADVVFDRLETDFSSAVWNATDKRGVDLVFDGVGEAVWTAALRTLARNGRLVTYGATTGHDVRLDIRRIFWKQLRIIGTTLASRHELDEVLGRVFEGALAPVVDHLWPLENARQAHEYLEAGRVFGKIVLTVNR